MKPKLARLLKSDLAACFVGGDDDALLLFARQCGAAASPHAPQLLASSEVLPAAVDPPGAPPTPPLRPLRALGRGAFAVVTLACGGCCGGLGGGGPGRARCGCAPLAVKQLDAAALYGALGGGGAGLAHYALRELRCLRIAAAGAGAGARFLARFLGARRSRCGRWLYLLSEFCPGGTLLDALRARGGALPPWVARAHAACALAALAALHRVGVAHRDVKPSNIGVGADGFARLLDFGFARTFGGGGAPAAALLQQQRQPPPPPPAALAAADAAWRAHAAAGRARCLGATESAALLAHAAAAGGGSDDAPPAQARARSSSLLGSTHHMAPEVGAAEGADWGADVWALGVTLFELLTGLAPCLSGAPAWAGDAGSGAGRGSGGGLEAAAPAAPPEALVAALPPAAAATAAGAFILATLAPAGERPSAEALMGHPFFASPLPPGAAGGAGAWAGAVDWGALCAGATSAPPPPAPPPAPPPPCCAGAPAAAAGGWGAGTWRAGGGDGGDGGDGDDGALPFDDPLLVAAEFGTCGGVLE